MAYCLGYLVEILEQILHTDQHHQTWVLHHDKLPQIQSLLGNASFVQNFLANSSPVMQARIESLEDQIRDAAEKAENILESSITNQLRSYPEGHTFVICPPDLQGVIEVFESVKQEMLKIMEDVSRKLDQRLEAESRVVASSRDPSLRDMVVGVSEDLIKLKNRLTGQSSQLQMIPIVGMGGTGKTTLARILYDEFTSNKSHFDICAWATVSQDYNIRGILLSLLSCISNKKPTDDMLQQENHELMVTLHKSLYRRRYLIVLDDVWSYTAWDDMQTFFADDNQGSRIILTTRENGVADHVNSKSHNMHLLDSNDSWELLRKKVYHEESCPHELEEVGRKIADSCSGLPLAIQVISGVLSHAERSKDSWEKVASNVSSSIINADEQFSEIFSLSYAHLPHYLKPCLLYMAAFPEDYDIRASRLIKLCVAEGFLNVVGDKSKEEAAEVYLKSLANRSLIFVRKRKPSGEVKFYGMHDLLRNLCLRKSEESKFLCVKVFPSDSLTDDPLCVRRVSVHSSLDHRDAKMFVKLDSLVRSCQCFGLGVLFSVSSFELSLLRVLDLFHVVLPMFPEIILQLVNLRYLALTCCSKLPSNISVLRYLETLIIRFVNVEDFVDKIFDVPHLKHVMITKRRYWNPVQVDRSFALHEKLQSLSVIPVEMLAQLLGKIPNLRKLGINYNNRCYSGVVDLSCFYNLEALKISYFHNKVIFPDTLKKLTLHNGSSDHTFLNIIGGLPNLEVLKIKYLDLYGNDLTWEPSEGEFGKLQYLLLHSWYLNKWLVDETHFPVLRHLVIRDCFDLEDGIPLDIGGIDTLEIIEVDDCDPHIMKSARRILKEQRHLGNDILELRLDGLRYELGESDDDDDDYGDGGEEEWEDVTNEEVEEEE